MARTVDPFREMDRFMNGIARVAGPGSMPMNLYREGDRFVAEVELPGVDPSSIDVDVEERTLTIRAERKESPAGEGRRWLTRERAAGTFARQLNLGQGRALDRIEADYSDGVLTLTIPVAEQAKPRKISVTHGGAAPVAAEAQSRRPSTRCLSGASRRSRASRMEPPAPPAPPWTRVTRPTTGRSARPARSWPPTSTSPWASRAPSSTSRA